MKRRPSWVPLPRLLVSGQDEHVPHRLTRREGVGYFVRFLLAELLVVVAWSSLRLVGMQPIGKPPIAVLVWSLVVVAGIAIFGLHQELKGRRGIGWLGAILTGTAATSASLIAGALSAGR